MWSSIKSWWSTPARPMHERLAVSDRTAHLFGLLYIGCGVWVIAACTVVLLMQPNLLRPNGWAMPVRLVSNGTETVWLALHR
jgi:hypothetical protein